MPVIRQLEATRGPRAPHETTDDLGQRATAPAEFRMISLLRQQDMQEMHGYRLGLDHVSCGFLWTESLQRTAARRVRFVLRGLAGPTRFEPFAAGYGRAACSKWTEVATNHGGYRYVFHAARTGAVSQQSSWWMLFSRNLKRSLCPCLCRKRTGWPRVEGEVVRAFASLIGLVLFTS